MSPVVSPDERHLAFLRVRTAGRVAVFLVPLTSGLAPIGTPRQLTDEDSGVIGLAWTPDGRDPCSCPAGISACHVWRRS